MDHNGLVSAGGDWRRRLRRGFCFAAASLPAAIAAEPKAASPEKIVPDKTLNFPNGDWNGVPETGPDKKVRQCVVAARRARASAGGNVDTALSLIISRGSGLAFAITDSKMPPERILDDQAEAVADDHAFPAVAFTVGSRTLAFHPGDAAAALAALEKIDDAAAAFRWRRRRYRADRDRSAR